MLTDPLGIGPSGLGPGLVVLFLAIGLACFRIVLSHCPCAEAPVSGLVFPYPLVLGLLGSCLVLLPCPVGLVQAAGYSLTMFSCQTTLAGDNAHLLELLEATNFH